MKTILTFLLLFAFTYEPVQAQIHLDEKEAYKVFKDYFKSEIFFFYKKPIFISSKGETMTYKELESLTRLKYIDVDSSADKKMVPYDTNFVMNWSNQKYLKKKMETEENLRFIYLSTYPKMNKISNDSLLKIRLKIGNKKLGTSLRLGNPIFIGSKNCLINFSSYHGPLYAGWQTWHLKKKKGKWKRHCTLREMVS